MHAAILLPPFRPRATIYGILVCIISSLDCTTLTKPTGTPMISAGFIFPSPISSSAKKERADAVVFKEEYETKLKEVDKEAQVILSEARKKAMKTESQIVAEAKEEAARIIARANAEVELEKKRALDEMKQEMVAIASLMAGKVVKASIDTNVQESLIDETLKEMGERTWLS